MNCDLAQRRLVTSDEPDRPAGDVAAHLSECPACQEWQRQIVQLERQVSLLPVPPSVGVKEKFLQRFAGRAASQTPAPQPRLVQPPVLRIAQRQTSKERGLRKLSLAFAMAAALVLFAVGWWAWQHEDQTTLVLPIRPATDPLVGSLLQRDLRLAAAKTPRERVEALAEIADELHGGIRSLAQGARAEDLAALTTMYKEVVTKGLVTHARQLPANERAAVLEPIASRLLRVGNEAEQLADGVSPETAKALRDMAATARAGDEKLRQLVQEVRG